MERVAFVILHYGEIQVTVRCVCSILNLEHRGSVDIVIVDNHVQEDVSERQKKWQQYERSSNIFVLYNRGSGGFSEGNNLGYAFAKKMRKAHWIIVANNDVTFGQKDFLRCLQQISDKLCADQTGKNTIHIIAPDVRRRDRRFPHGFEHQNPLDTEIRTAEEAKRTIRLNKYFRKNPALLYPAMRLYEQTSLLKKIKKSAGREKDEQGVMKGIVPFGACLICTPAFVLREEKLFYPETQFFYEEYLLALRCSRKDYHIWYCPDLIVRHEGGVATGLKYKKRVQIAGFRSQQMEKACRIYLRELTGKEQCAEQPAAR